MPKKKIKKQYQDFARFNKDMQRATGYIGQVFEEVAQLAGLNFVNNAKTLSKQEGLVDTGNYRRNWSTDIDKLGHTYQIVGFNPVEYSSFLEYGHKIKGSDRRFKGRFIGTQAIYEVQEYAVNELKKKLGDLYDS